MRYIRLIGTALIALCLLASCKQKKEIGTAPSSASKVIALQKTEKQRIATVIDAQPAFKTFQSKLNMTLNRGSKSISANGTFKLVKNERLQISVQPFLGIEMLRAEFSNDSIKLLDRIGRRYVAESIASYRESLPVDIRFETLQSLFMNQLFMPGESSFKSSDYKHFNWRTESDGLLVGRLNENKELFILNFMVNAGNQLAQTQVANTTNTHVVDWKYSQFQPLEKTTFPVKSSIQYHSNNRNISVELVYSRIELDEKLQMSFSIPSSYTKIQLTDLVKALLKK